MTRNALVLGAGGFIGGHLAQTLKAEGYWVRGVDIKQHEHRALELDDFVQDDLRDFSRVHQLFDRPFDEVYQLAADMGGAGYLFTGENDADIVHNSTQINLNTLRACTESEVCTVFYASSACVYPEYNQLEPDSPMLAEGSVYPAQPDSEYGWEKLFSERLFDSYRRNHGINSRIGRFHNVFGPYGTWQGGKEKVPAALCRKVALAQEHGEVEVWGDGRQTRSFLYIDECIEAIRRLMASECQQALNIGSEEMISINDLARMIIDISGKSLSISHSDGPQGVRGRTSDNTLIENRLGWKPSMPLREGMEKTYQWIERTATQSASNGSYTNERFRGEPQQVKELADDSRIRSGESS
ncbi:MAG: NAD-dependent epimerase/dehydratase family protein [Pseudomonadota bacterium]